MSRIERARVWTPEEKDWRAVVCGQPHRRADPENLRLGYALGRMCVYHKIGEVLEQVGVDYGQLYRRAMAYLGTENGLPRDGNGEIVLTEVELRERKEREIKNLKEAENVLIRIDRRLKGRMHSVCVLDFDPPQDHVGMIRDGLIALEPLFRSGKRK